MYHSQLSPGSLTSLMLYTLNLALAFGFLSSLYGDFMKVCTYVHTYVTKSAKINCVRALVRYSSIYFVLKEIFAFCKV